jgi:hypothetical protein
VRKISSLECRIYFVARVGTKTTFQVVLAEPVAVVVAVVVAVAVVVETTFYVQEAEEGSVDPRARKTVTVEARTDRDNGSFLEHILRYFFVSLDLKTESKALHTDLQ